jgi:hypothetical protein
MADDERVDAELARNGGISYLHIPAVDARVSADFYEAVFGWNVSGKDTNRPSFSDGGGQVAGAWMTDQEVSRTPGLLPYVYVERIDDAVARVEANGGVILVAPYPEGNLRVATFRDPAGNVIGLWQEA